MHTSKTKLVYVGGIIFLFSSVSFFRADSALMHEGFFNNMWQKVSEHSSTVPHAFSEAGLWAYKKLQDCTSYFRSMQELPIVIITSSYNNAPWAMRYLDSVVSQRYENYRIIYIDDCSQDGTADMVAAYAAWLDIDHKITLIKNESRKLKLENIYRVIHACDDTDIILILDGDDWFAHQDVLANINKKYQEEDVWFVYGQVKFFADGQLGIGQAIPEDNLANLSFRNLPWIFRHPITFYAWLFKLIRLKDLLCNDVPGYQSKFYPICNDRAMIYPMLEMSQYHYGFIPEVAIIQNRFNPLSLQNANNQQLAQDPLPSTCWKENRHRPIQHAPLADPIINRLAPYMTAKADCIIFSDNNASGLADMLELLPIYIKGVGYCYVLYQADDQQMEKEYQALAARYPRITFGNIGLDSRNIVSDIINLPHEHLLLLSDAQSLARTIDCSYAIFNLELTYAYTFDTGISIQNLDALGVPYQHIGNGLYAWKFYCDKQRKVKVHHSNGALYKKNVVIDGLYSCLCSSVAQVQALWESIFYDANNIGLFAQGN